MSNPFEPFIDDSPDEIDLELWMLGELDPKHYPRLEAIQRGPLADSLTELETYRDWWASAERAPLLVPKTSQRMRSRFQALPWLLAALVLFAVLVASWSYGPGRPEDLSGVRAMGAGLAVDVAAVRDGVPVHVSEIAGGDLLLVRFVAPRTGWMDVATVQADGQVSVVSASQITAGERFSLDGAVRLDNHRGKEWLVVTVSEHRRSEEEITHDLRELLPVPSSSDDQWVLDVTRSP